MDLEKLILERIRDVPDYPKPGIVFKDITPLLADHTAFAGVVDAVVAHYGRGTIDKVVGIEARGFILAAPIAYHFGAGFVPVRKRASSRPRPTSKAMTWSTARRRSRSTKTRSGPANASLSSTTCSPRAAPPGPAPSWCGGVAATWPDFPCSWSFLS